MANRAGTPAQPQDLVDLKELTDAYYSVVPDSGDPDQRVSFGTSGHRGSSFKASFNEAHIAAITQAIVEYRAGQGYKGPLYMGRDTHALSGPAQETALEVLAGNEVHVLVDSNDGYVPTPSLSHAILTHNAKPSAERADGIVITPSHNPPTDGGFKYNPPHGGPADSDATSWIADRANELLENDLAGVKRLPLARAKAADTTGRFDFMTSYVSALPEVIDLEAIRDSGLRIGADPMGSAAVEYWITISERFGLNMTVVNPEVDPRWSFMTLDWDEKIRMDCSSPNAMASLIASRDKYDIATGNDADSDRHGIVTPDEGLMNPNHYLAVAIDYLYSHRPDWPGAAGVGKTLVSSSVIDKVAASLNRPLVEVPVGFKFFVAGLMDGSLGFGGEESAGASFLRKDGSVWTTDKDGIILALLAAEMTAVTGKTPSQRYAELTEDFGSPSYARIDAPANREQKAKLKKLSAADVTATELAGEAITATLTEAPGNGEPIGGLKVVTENAWFAARPSGTEDVYKIYAESFKGDEHLAEVQKEAKALVDGALS
ncbi:MULTISPECIES: phosphoglucomutase (alpha-D-glucose-1,6-bisphosphate-dependent) [Micrococcaceae]|uniref:phosphoglucomutase (alpha-D-glucose-1,6-bisphosphate-dependent) n=1 Tax=unclassified Kocuria TaxID=2649579 RepID=UPI001012DE19|nr:MULTISPECIES: phosphoglucomutase (alpha-D-glucose-1,6-bisphosphate-dependent) [unclassified Kocuria]